MKKAGIFLWAIIGCTGAWAQQQNTITISNPLAQERKEELVVLSRSWLATKIDVTAYPYCIIKNSKGVPAVVQFDDLDNDGRWDEAVFLCSLAPKERLIFTVTASNTPATVKAMVRAHVRQRHKLADESFGPQVLRDTMPYNNKPTDFSRQKLPPYLTEGPAWENDKVGFRKYFDTRNANDIWGKVTNRMVLEEVGVDPSKIYHHFDADWGMDILKVGASLGAGALALQVKVNGKDSVMRLGTNVQQTIYEQVADGPLRAIFRIHYKGWKAALNGPVDITEEISIWGGQYFFQNKVTVTQLPSDARLITGVIDFYQTGFQSFRKNKIAGVSTYGVQSENKDQLGLAVLAPAAQVTATGALQAGGIANTFGVWLKAKADKPQVYRFYACWEKTDPLFNNAGAFHTYLQQQAMRWHRPVTIK